MCYSYKSVLISFACAFLIFLIRKRFLSNPIYICCYYFVFIGFFGFMTLAGSSVFSDAYDRLQIFKELERNNLLLVSKNNPSQYNGMFQIDLQLYNNSEEFQQYVLETCIIVSSLMLIPLFILILESVTRMLSFLNLSYKFN